MIEVQSKDLAKLARLLRNAEKEVTKELRRGLVDAAKEAQRDIKSEAKATGSKRTVRSVKTRVRLSGRRAEVSVFTSRKVAPHAHLFETGKRHPVYGKGWAPMPKRPFFRETARRSKPRAQELIVKAINDVARRVARGVGR